MTAASLGGFLLPGEIDNKKSRLIRRDFDWCGGVG
jgi:hypothetical protein